MKLAFVYAGGRESRREDARAGRAPTDFFYGAVELSAAGHEVSVVDAPEAAGSFAAWAYNSLLKWCMPARTRGEHLVATWRILPRLREADAVVATSTSHALALAIWKRAGLLPARLLGIHCGLVNFPLTGARRRATRRMLGSQEVVLFADAEREETLAQFDLDARTVHANAFGVDAGFWTPGGKPGDYVLAVGSDGRRDYETLVEAARMSALPVRIVTQKDLPLPLPPNVAHIQGSWHEPALSDAELRDLYRGARMVVVPLEDSIQPSGQSVALQAMACGRPVILTRTRGLWTGEDFLDERDLLLVDAGSSKSLLHAIRRLADDAALNARMGLSAREAVLRQGGIEAFASRLNSLLADPKS